MNIPTFARKGTSRWLLAGVAVCVAIGALSLRSWTAVYVQPAELVEAQPEESNEPIQPIEPVPNLDPRKVALGQKLFGDPRLSDDNHTS